MSSLQQRYNFNNRFSSNTSFFKLYSSVFQSSVTFALVPSIKNRQVVPGNKENRFIKFTYKGYFATTRLIHFKSVLGAFGSVYLRNQDKRTSIGKWIARDKSCASSVKEKSFGWTVARTALIIQFSFISAFLPHEENVFSLVESVSLGLPYHPFPAGTPRWSKHRLRRADNTFLWVCKHFV